MSTGAPIRRLYIAASWKHRHAVEMLTSLLRQRGWTVLSFVENNHGEDTKRMPFDEWVHSPDGDRSFIYDTDGATRSHLVVYIGPSGKDAAAEVGAAWAAGVPVLGLLAKGEDFGLMRRMIEWHRDFRSLLKAIESYRRVGGLSAASPPAPAPEAEQRQGAGLAGGAV